MNRLAAFVIALTVAPGAQAGTLYCNNWHGLGLLEAAPREQARRQAGMLPDQAERALGVNAVPEEQFETLIEGDKPLSVTTLAGIDRRNERAAKAVRQPATGPCVGCGRPLSLMVVRWCGRSRSEAPRRVMLCADCQRTDRKAKRRRPPWAPTACARCGETFIPLRSDARFCSTRCRVASHRAVRAKFVGPRALRATPAPE